MLSSLNGVPFGTFVSIIGWISGILGLLAFRTATPNTYIVWHYLLVLN